MKRTLKNRIMSQWKQLEGEVRTRWNKLSNEDFQRIGGQRDKLVFAIQQRYGIPPEEAHRQVEEWTARL
jgi:uncharacterized protein YjbJ (UPF0337 family)